MTEYVPDYASPPGDTILEVLEEAGTSITELAIAMPYPASMLCDIIFGDAPITNDIADKLAVALGIPAEFWLRRESLYRAACYTAITA